MTTHGTSQNCVISGPSAKNIQSQPACSQQPPFSQVYPHHLAKSGLIFRYLVARENNESAAPVAFAHFRYDMDYDDEVLYVYEIQGLVAHKIDKITCSQRVT